MDSKKVIAVVSDSHGNFDALRQVVELHPEVDALLFLGDGMRDFEDLQALYPTIPMMGVPGNCDYDCMENHTKVYFCGGKKLLLTHGHFYNVKMGTEYLLATARAASAAAVLYGHTHWSVAVREPDGLWRINPGSIGYSRRYALITISGRNMDAQLCRLPEPEKKEE